MIILEDLKQQLDDLKPEIDELYSVLNMEKCKSDLEELQQMSAMPDFWNDADNSQKVTKQIRTLENKVSKYEKLVESYDDAYVLIQLAEEE